jgi:TPR repeat protein
MSNGFSVAEKVMSASGYGIPNSPTYHYDLERQFESDMYTQDDIKDLFSFVGVDYKGVIDDKFIDELANFYVSALVEGDKGKRNSVIGSMVNIIDPGSRIWDNSRVDIGRLKEGIHNNLAQEESSDEQFNLAVNYEFGQLGFIQDIYKARDLYTKSANRGLDKAQHNLALMYENGKGVPRDVQEAIKWYTKAAEQGLSLSQFNLAQIYSDIGTNQSFKEAIRWYEECKDNDFMGKFQLGLLVHMGIGTEQDRSRGLRLLKEAADEGGHETKVKLEAYLSKLEDDEN